MVINVERTRVRADVDGEDEEPFQVPQKLESQPRFDVTPHDKSENYSTIYGVQENNLSGKEVLDLESWFLQHFTDRSGKKVN